MKYKYKDLIKKARDAKFGVQQFFESLNLNHSTGRDHFLKEYGINPLFFLQYQRAIWVRHLINDGRTLQDIVEIVGYNDVSYMIKDFKRWFAITPKQMLMTKKMKMDKINENTITVQIELTKDAYEACQKLAQWENLKIGPYLSKIIQEIVAE